MLKRQREEEKEEQTTHAATQREHFKNQEIFNSNQIRKKYIERHDKNGDNNSNSVGFFCLFVSQEDQKEISNLKNTKSKKQLLHRAVDNKKHILGVRLLLCVQFICIEEAHLPVLAAITAQQSRIKHSENINYKALQNNRKRGETVIGENKSFMLAVTEKYTNVTP